MTATTGAPSWETFRHEAMATEFALMIDGKSPEYARQAATAAWREVDRLEGELSRYIDSSDIARANRLAAGEAITIGDDALRCLLLAAEISAATDRAFDPAYASEQAMGDESDAVLFALDPSTHTLTSLTARLHLDLGAVGKGYALDVVAEVLRDWDISAACLQSGGSTALALAAPAGAAGWPIGIGEGMTRRAGPLSHHAVSGSGLAVKGEHLIDPRSRQTAPRQERAWAFAATGAVADALSTAFFVMRDPEIARYCAAHPGVGAMIALPDGGMTAYGDVPADFVKTTNT